ncbi:MAG TPA: hypothetical protein DDZ67_00555 [Xanthomonadaceae bacterium]|nr:hypothetical protein [Xanthomonadaceae bacterium]
MKSHALGCAVMFALFSLSTTAVAQDQEEESSSPFSGTFAVTNDYVFRGVSQTNEDPAFQAGLTYTSPIGLYVGTWASNVDFGPGDPDWEVDGFVGYAVDFSENWNFDVVLNRYNYPGAGASNYNELITKTTFLDTYSLTVAYTDDVYGLDEDSFYYALDASWSLPQDFSFGLHVGRTTYASALDEFYKDYTDYAATVGKTFGPLDLSVGYYDTSRSAEYGFGKQNSDGRVAVVATVSWP